MPLTLTQVQSSIRTVLIIDDDSDALEAWAQGLASSRYRVFKATNVKSAMDIYRSQKIDCVVLDLDMEHESGFEVLLDLIPNRYHRDTAIVVFTRLVSPTIREMALEHGAQAFLIKQQTSPQHLDQAIQEAIISVSSGSC